MRNTVSGFSYHFPVSGLSFFEVLRAKGPFRRKINPHETFYESVSSSQISWTPDSEPVAPITPFSDALGLFQGITCSGHNLCSWEHFKQRVAGKHWDRDYTGLVAFGEGARGQPLLRTLVFSC